MRSGSNNVQLFINHTITRSVKTVMPLDEVYPTVEYQLKEKLKVDEYQRLLSLSAESSP